jgi:NitT/TauT family transport system ATP-binding protein
MTMEIKIPGRTEGAPRFAGTADGDSPAAISIRGLRHEYVDTRAGKRVFAIEAIDLDLREGELVCVLGQSGCGKTTLLYLVAGLLHPTAGEIYIDGKRITGPGRDRGVVFQDYALLPWKTVRSNIGLGLKLQGMGPAQRRPIEDRFIKLVGLEGFEDAFPHELSGGMRQRVAVARTLAADPRVVLMDEPFAAVDAQTRITLQQELVRIWRETKKTILFVTHSVEEAAYLADRVVVLSARPSRVKEVVVADFAREERTPANAPYAAFTAQLLASVRDSRA